MEGGRWLSLFSAAWTCTLRPPSPLGVTHFQAEVLGHSSISLETFRNNSHPPHLSPIYCPRCLMLRITFCLYVSWVLPRDEWCPTQHGSCVKSALFFFFSFFLTYINYLLSASTQRKISPCSTRGVEVGRKGGCPGFLL